MNGFSDVGDVDMFGLDEFGEPTGLPGWAGAMIGGAAATGSTLAVRRYSKSPALLKHAEGVGLGVGLAAGGAMWLMGSKARHAGLVAAGTAVATNGLRWLSELFMTPAVAGWGGVEINRTGVIFPGQVMQGDGGMGIATIDPTGVIMSGTGMGVGADGMPQLLSDSPVGQRTAMAQLIGVPGLGGSLSGMASSFGATVLGGGRG